MKLMDNRVRITWHLIPSTVTPSYTVEEGEVGVRWIHVCMNDIAVSMHQVRQRTAGQRTNSDIDGEG
jgi:hypothetical protein